MALSNLPWLATSALARLGPLARIAVWLMATASCAALVQALAWIVGIDFSILAKSGGSAVFISIALVLLLALVAHARRSMAEYGLVADKNWLRHGTTGFAAGVAVYGGYCVAVWLAGVYTLQLHEVTAYRCVKAVLACATSPVVAVAQQIIFSGLLLSMLRQRHGRWLAVVLPAALFAVACCLPKLAGATASDLAPLAVGMFLLAVLLGLLRLRTGNIALASGVLAGAIAIRKLLAKTHLVALAPAPPLAQWLAPGGDPRQAPALFVILTAAIAVAAVLVVRFGEQQASPAALRDAGFMRIMPFSNLLAFAPLDRWLSELVAARFRVGMKYWPRLLVTLAGSALNTALSLPERLVAPLVMRHPVPPPVFIVGMPRSGTTHLHNLLALDPQFRAPRNYEVFNPHGFVTGWLTTAIMAPFMSWRRPMDAVQMSVWTPQEEEFALAAMGRESPYWSFVFPKQFAVYDAYWMDHGWDPAAARRWEYHYALFLRKLTCWRRRPPLLKNPANTGRVQRLAQLFPGARFVHIVRHPFAVVRSNAHLAQHGLVAFQLQDPPIHDSYEARALGNYRRLIYKFYADAAALSQGHVAEVRFEDLERDPVGEVERIYRELGLQFSGQFRGRLVPYLEGLAGYRKNQFEPLDEQERLEIVTAMEPYLARWGYRADGAVAAPAVCRPSKCSTSSWVCSPIRISIRSGPTSN